MKEAILSSNNYAIFRVSACRLYDIAGFVVKENYHHHSCDVNGYTQNEVTSIINEERLFQSNSRYFIARNKSGDTIGCIRVYKWDKKTQTPMQKIFNFSPLERLPDSVGHSIWHIGRFAVKSSLRFSTITLFKQLMLLAVETILRDPSSGYMIAEVDKHLLKIMHALGLELIQIGQPVVYLASETIPVYASRTALEKFYARHASLLTMQ